MTNRHYQNGYRDMYTALTKVAEPNLYNYNMQQDQGHPHLEGAISGLTQGALGGGLIGAGTGLYGLNQDRSQLMGALEKRMRSRAKVRPPLPPNMVTSLPSGTGRVHPEAEFLYGLKPEEIERLTKNPLSTAKSLATPERLEEALGRIKGVEGFGRYALARKGVPLLSALHWGLPAAAIGLAAGGLLGS